ncbi:MAG TPA: hypothetical protein VHZ51_31405 [Ktedonobacteraceae bacterium]|nr:hypothetical protein [Ktedonobacteraceae bacterium]
MHKDHSSEAKPRPSPLDQLEAEEARRQGSRSQVREDEPLTGDGATIRQLSQAEIKQLSERQLDAAIKKLRKEALKTSQERTKPADSPVLGRLYLERGRRLTARIQTQVDPSGIMQGSIQRKLSTGAGCVLFAVLTLLIAIFFWAWVFLVILVFDPNTPQTLWPAVAAIVIGGDAIIGSYFWLPPLYASVKRAYLQRYGEEALAEIASIQHEISGWRSGGNSALSWVQLDWRWQMSDGQICQDNTVYRIQDQDKRTLQKYRQFVATYARGKRFPVYFLPKHPHVLVVPAVKRRARIFVSDLFTGGNASSVINQAQSRRS